MADTPQTIDNPVIKGDDPEAERLIALATKAGGLDNKADPEPEPSAQPAPRAAEALPTDDKLKVAPDNPEASAVEGKGEPARDELGRFTKADGSKSEPGEKAPEPVKTDVAPVPKEDSQYEKARKDQERLARNRREFEEEKARERAGIQAERDRLAQERQQLQSPQQEQFGSKAYDKAAEDWERQAEQDIKNGETEAAAANYALAAKARKAAHEIREGEIKQTVETQKSQLGQIWKGHMEDTIQKNRETEPDLANPDSEVGKQILNLLKSRPWLEYIPNGFTEAYEVVKLQRAAAKASGLEEANNQLKAELERYQKLTSIGGSGPTRHTGVKRPEDMTAEEFGAYLERKSAEAGAMAA